MQQAFSTITMVIEFLLSEELRIWLRLLRRPALVVAALVLILCVGAWLDAKLAHAGRVVQDCGAGMEFDGGYCYPVCADGFYGTGPVCWEKCPAGSVDGGAVCVTQHTFAKYTYGRGGGTGLVCAANEEFQGGICYPKCAPTHYGVGVVCWQRCPTGYADHGVTCFRGIFDFFGKNTYGRGVGRAVHTCPAGMQQDGTFCYPRCNAGFDGVGPVCWQQCPASYTDQGAFCTQGGGWFKQSYGRGAGVAANEKPVAFAVEINTTVNTPVSFRLIGTDLNHDPLTYQITDPVTGGKLTGTPPDLTFDPVGIGPHTTVFFGFTVSDGKAVSGEAFVTFHVNADPNSAPPVATDQRLTTMENAPITVTVHCVDPEGDLLAYKLVQKPQQGDLRWIGRDQLIYTPHKNFVGQDSFQYDSSDGVNRSNVSTVALIITPAVPRADDQTVPVMQDQPITFTLAVTDPDSDVLTSTLVTSPTHGIVSGNGVALVYQPFVGYHGSDSFTYRVNDEQFASNVATVTFNVQPQNAPPLAQGQVLTVTQGVTIPLLLLGDDAEGSLLAFTVVSPPQHGALSGVAPDLFYLADAAFSGSDTFTFKTNDGQADSPLATVTINVVAAPAEAALVGLVFDDRNDNGQPDADETGIGGLLVTLTPTSVRAAATTVDFTTMTDGSGAWRLDGVPLGQYNLRIRAAAGLALAAPLTAQVTVEQRGVQQMQLAGVKVINRSLFLPSLMR